MPDKNNGIRFRTSEEELIDQFESGVWRKIGRKKQQRKLITVAVGCLVAAAIIWGVGGFEPTSQPPLAKVQTQVSKEEIPLMENLVFAAGDQLNQYPLETIPKRKPSDGNRFAI